MIHFNCRGKAVPNGKLVGYNELERKNKEMWG